jgi:hypothetical protein
MINGALAINWSKRRGRLRYSKHRNSESVLLNPISLRLAMKREVDWLARSGSYMLIF